MIALPDESKVGAEKNLGQTVEDLFSRAEKLGSEKVRLEEALAKLKADQEAFFSEVSSGPFASLAKRLELTMGASAPKSKVAKRSHWQKKAVARTLLELGSASRKQLIAELKKRKPDADAEAAAELIVEVVVENKGKWTLSDEGKNLAGVVEETVEAERSAA